MQGLAENERRVLNQACLSTVLSRGAGNRWRNQITCGASKMVIARQLAKSSVLHSQGVCPACVESHCTLQDKTILGLQYCTTQQLVTLQHFESTEGQRLQADIGSAYQHDAAQQLVHSLKFPAS